MTTIFEPCEEEAMAILTYNVGATVMKSQKVIIDDWNGFSLTGKEIAELENFPDGKEEQAEHKRASKRIAYRIAKDFKAWSGKNSKMKHRYLGVVLSFAEGDRAKLEADPQLRQQIIQDWLGDMGYDDAQFLAVYHDEANKPHIHIILNLVDMNHKAFDRYRDRYRSQKACRDIEKEYDLKVGLGVDEKYEVNLEKTGKKNQERVKISRIAKTMLRKALSFDDFVSSLQERNITVTVVTNNNGTSGLIFRMGDDGIPFAGGKVHSSLTFGKINERITKNKAALKGHRLCALLDTVLPQGNPHTPKTISVTDASNFSLTYELPDGTRRRVIVKDDKLEIKNGVIDLIKDKYIPHQLEPIQSVSVSEPTARQTFQATDPNVPSARKTEAPPAQAVTPSVAESVAPATNQTVTPAPSKEKTKSERIAGLIEEANKKGSLQTIIKYINETHFGDSAEYHVVPGTMEPIPEGIRLNLSEDGYTSDGFNIYPLQLNIAPIHGKRYIDFTFNADGHLVAHIELDPNDYYSYGRQGDFNLITGKRTLSPREYRGTPEEYAQKQAKQSVLPKKKSKKFGKGI